MAEPRVVKRKAHTKSRKGCLQCKQRHTKCNEAQPRCANCARLDIPCAWPVATDGLVYSPQQTSPGAASLLKHHPSGGSPNVLHDGDELPVADLRLLHHWMSTCAQSLHANPALRGGVWRHELVEVGFEFPFLLRGFLAISAIHKASLLPLAERQGLLAQADAHVSRALDTYRRHLEAPSIETAIPMFILSTVLLMYNFGSAQLDKPEDPIRGLHHCFMLLQGIKVIVIPFRDHINSSAMITHATGMASQATLQALDELAKQDNPQEILRLKELVELLLDSQDKEACITAINELHETMLRFRHLGLDEDEYSLLFLWPARLTNRFFNLLAAQNPVACIVTTHFAALLAQSRPIWWVGKWPQWLLTASEQLIAATPDLLQWLDWPQQIIRAHTWGEPQ
ncbi:hypothetical protein ACN47E_009731 [Coniothyrium glycines]